MKKNVKNKIVSLLLSATAFCCFGALLPFMSKTDAEAETIYRTLDGLTMNETAAIRTIEPNGIRFTTDVSVEKQEEIKGLINNPQYGTLLLPADMLGSQELTHETKSIVDSVAKIWWDADSYTAVLAGSYNADGTFSNLPESYYNRPIAARSYVKGTDNKGNTVIYYSETTAVRSIGYVAYMASKDPNAVQSDLVDAIAAQASVELVFDDNNQVSVYQNETVGTTIIENKFNKSTDSAAVIKIGGVALSAEQMEDYGVSITYTSDNSAAISANGSIVTAVAAGTANLTASATFDGMSLQTTKTMSSSVYKPQSEYKILISEAAANGPFNASLGYKAFTEEEYAKYYTAFEKDAAYKVQKLLQESTGLKLEIVSKKVAGQKYISIGETELGSAESLVFMEDGVVVTDPKKTASQVNVDDEGNIIICGVTQQGTLYGVQELLDDLIGYEYFMENTYTLDKNVEVVLAGNKSFVPDIEFNVTQSYERVEGVMDDYGMQIYTENIIPVGTSEWEDNAGHTHIGVSHNSVLILNGGMYDTKSIGNVTADWKFWYATNSAETQYLTMNNPYYSGTDNENTAYDESKSTLKSELCYTGHGKEGVRDSMITTLVDAMYAKMQKFPGLSRVGFSQMDHRAWCECSTCTAQGTPSDNLLEFLLDVAAQLKTKLQNAGDARANTFTIATLFYHETNQAPKNYTNYEAKMAGYMKHIEVWFAETGVDHVDPFNNTDNTNNWNEKVYGFLIEWAGICNTYGADMLLWEYYANTTSFFIPYDTVNAIRVNYGIFADLGIDYIFNQMMASRQTWARLKQYLMSKLEWNAHPDDTEFNGWMDAYFEGSYGPGAEKMREYYDAMQEWSKANIKLFRADNNWDPSGVSGASLTFDARKSSYLKESKLKEWINLINEAEAALDINDPNYETYRRNMKLEKLTPLYLIMYIYDNYKESNGVGSFSKWGRKYYNTYGSEFIAWAEEWNIDTLYYGEGDSLKPFVNAIKDMGVAAEGVSRVFADKQYLEVSANATLNNLALADGTYKVSINDGASTSVTASGGMVTLNASALTAGSVNKVVFTDSKGVTTTYTNVVAVTKLSATAGAISGSNGYYYIDKTFYVEKGATLFTINHNAFQRGTYEVTIDGVSSTASTTTAGTLNIAISALDSGEIREVSCVDQNGNTIVFNIFAVTFIRTVEEFKAIGVGGYINVKDEGGNIVNVLQGADSKNAGYDNSGYYVLANDLDFGGESFSPGHNYGQSNFIGTFDGNGYTISNVKLGDSGLFGGLKGATIKNTNFEGIIIDLKNYYPGWNYGALLANAAEDTIIENITATYTGFNVTAGYNDPNGNDTKYHWGLVIANGTKNVTYNNVTLDVTACANNLYSIFGTNIEAMSASNVKVIMTQTMVDWMQSTFGGIIYGYSDNKDTRITTSINGVSIVTKSFTITNTQKTIGLGESSAITTDQPAYTYTYALKQDVVGVSISGNTVSVSTSAIAGTTFTVIVEEAEQGLMREITFTITKAQGTFTDVPTIEVGNGNFTLPYGLNGDVRKISVNGLVIFDLATATGTLNGNIVTFGAKPVKQEHLGKGIEMVIETTTTYYTGKANVYTMIIDNKAELDQWQAVAANNSVEAGLCVEEQKNAVLSGYFILADDIEYNDTWKPILTYGDIWGAITSESKLSELKAKYTQSPEKDLIINEDWGRGEKAGFKGVFDGDGHYINGMKTSGEYSGFIITNAGGTIKNVAFTNASIGSTAAFLVNRGSGGYENIYIQVVSMESGVAVYKDGKVSEYKSTQVLCKQVNTHCSTAGMTNVLVDVSAIDYASLKSVFIANLAYINNNIYVVGMPEGITLEAQGEQEAPLVFLHCNTSENSVSDYDVAYGFVNTQALFADEKHGAVARAYDASFWMVDVEKGILLPYTVARNVEAEEVTATMSGTISAEKKVVVEGTTSIDVSSIAEYFTGDFTVTLDGSNLEVVSLMDNKLTLNAADFAKMTSTTAVLMITAGNMSIKLPVALDIVVELNASHAYSGTTLQTILNSKPNAHFMLTSDLDLKGTCLKYVTVFNGILDGQGFLIKNTYLHHEADLDNGYAPRFIAENNGTIKNIGFILDYITYVSGSGSSLRGIVNVNNGLVDNVYVQVNLNDSATSDYNNVGIISWTNSGTISNTVVNATVASGKEIKAGRVAGLAYNNNGTIINSYTINNGNGNVLAVQSGSTAGATAVASWSQINGSAFGKMWKIAADEIIFGYTNLTKNTSIGNTHSYKTELYIYEGSETALGFAAGTKVYQAPIKDFWNNRVRFTANDTSATYLSIEFSLGASSTVSSFHFWPVDQKGNYKTTANGIVAEGDPVADTRTIVIVDKNGKDVTGGPWAANTVYTMKIYLQGATTKIKAIDISTSNTGNNLYFGNITCVKAIDLAETVEFVSTSGKFALPTTIEGTVTGVSLEGVNIFTGMDGNKVTFDAETLAKQYTLHGENKKLVITTTAGEYLLEATVITKVIMTTQELRDLGVGGTVYTDREPTYNNSSSTDAGAGGNANSGVAGNDVLGYYVLGTDLDFAGERSVAAGYAWQQSWFKATFDGNGYTIYNISVNEGGIFGSLRGATIKNVNFVGVTHDAGQALYAGQYGQQGALFAHISDSSTFENINVQIANVITGRTWATLAYTFWNTNTLTNIDINATGIELSSVLGTDSQGKVTYTNVTIKAASYVEIGKKGGTVLTGWPTGITFSREYLVTDGNKNVKPVYTGDVTSLGFAAGTTVYEHTAPAATGTNIWTVMGNKANQVLLRKAADEDYASIQFVLGRDFTNASTNAFWAWVHTNLASPGNYAAGGYLAQNGSTSQSHNDDEKFNVTEAGFKFMVFDANGNAVTASNPLTAGVVYTLYAYGNNIVDVELATYAISGQPMTIYFANPNSGSVIDLAEEIQIGISDGNFVLPTTIAGDVRAVMLDGTSIFTGMNGAKVLFNKDAMPTDKAKLGPDRVLTIYTDMGIYELSATVATEIIRTAQELQALGVGGQIVDGVVQGQGNSAVAGNDKTGYYLLGEDLDCSGIYLAAGYNRSKSYFKGTFDGNGHTIANVNVSEGGIFGGMYKAEVKNVNFVNVAYLGTCPSGTKGYNNNQQYGQYFGLFAHAAIGITVTDVNIHITVMQYNKWNLGLFAYKVDDSVVSTYTNINVDASGLMFKNVLATNHNANNEVYNNVTFKAAGYETIASGNAAITEWPTGFTYTQSTASHSVKLNDNATALAYYTGDEEALGFANGTPVQYLATKDGYKDAYTKAGDTANSRALIPAKADGTATFQMVLSANLESSYLFHIWGVVGTSNSTSYAQVKSDGTATLYEGFTMNITDANGNAVSGKLKANTIYNVTLVAANDPAKGVETGFRLGILELQAITLYFANVNA